MDIIFQAHHATISESMRTRAERAVQKLASRLRPVVEAVVRIEEDGPMRRVEIVLRTPRQRSLVAEGLSRVYDTALAEAIGRLEAQVPKKVTPRARRRPGVSARGE